MIPMITISQRARRASFGAMFAIATLATACRKTETSAAATTPETMLIGPENVTVVQAQDIRTGPAISGSLTPEKSATIRAEMSGSVVQTYAEAGQRVRAGQPLAQLDASVLRDQQISAQGAVTTAQSAYDIAQREVSRATTLENAGAIAQRDLEQARNALVAARGQLATARAQLANINKQLDKASVQAPFDGVVSVRSVNAGDVVTPGTALYTVVDPGSMQLEASVPAEALTSVRVGMPVDFTVNGYPNRHFSGRITRVNPTADPTTRQVKILASIPNAGNTLVGGLYAEGRVSSESHNAPMIPISAVDERGLRPTVVRLRNGKVEKVEVALGIRDQAAETVEITSGLAAGDTVLLGAARGISPGTPVKVSAPSDVRK